MRFQRLSLCILALACLQISARASFADTYQLFNLGNDDRLFYGISSTGVAVFSFPSSAACGVTPNCYDSYLNGVNLGDSTTAPTFTPDNGSPCVPTLPPGWGVYKGVCNNGRVAWTGSYFGDPSTIYPFQVYFNNNPTSLPGPGPQLGGSAIFMNSIGDVIFDDGFGDNWYEAVDLTTLTPEPGSIVLLATGLLALAVMTRRRLHARAAGPVIVAKSHPSY